jgi:hypothetical protein
MEAGYLESPENGEVDGRVYDAANGAGCTPLPGEVAIAKDGVVGRLESLEILVWLEDGACGEGDGNPDEQRMHNLG